MKIITIFLKFDERNMIKAAQFIYAQVTQLTMLRCKYVLTT